VQGERHCEVPAERHCEVQGERHCEVPAERHCEVQGERHCEVQGGRHHEPQVERNSHHNNAKVSPRGEKTPHKERASRHIPKKIRREVRERDGNRCVYVDATTGKRCDCERGLQYDHIVPFARGGASNTSQNMRLLCPTHNRLAAEHVFELEFMNQKMRAGALAASQ
jgi:5-methylcytosine-specific restriction endonuclease McrA